MKILDFIIKIFEKFCGITLFIMTCVTFAQAFNRYVLGNSFTWADELTILGMIWITFLGSAIAIRKNSHTRIDFALNMLPEKIKRIVEFVDYILMAVFCIALFTVSLNVVSVNIDVLTNGLRIPRACMYFGLTFGMASMVVYLIALAICKLVNYNPDKVVEGGDN